MTGSCIWTSCVVIVYSHPMAVSAVLVRKSRTIRLGRRPGQGSGNAWMLEAAAGIAYLTVNVNPHAGSIGKTLHDRHFLRKHGERAYYGQARTKG